MSWRWIDAVVYTVTDFFFLLCFNKAAYIWVLGRWMRLLSLAFPFGRLSLENATHTHRNHPPRYMCHVIVGFVPSEELFVTLPNSPHYMASGAG